MPRLETCGVCGLLASALMLGRCQACIDRLRDLGRRMQAITAHCTECRLDLPMKAFKDALPGTAAVCIPCTANARLAEKRAANERRAATNQAKSRMPDPGEGLRRCADCLQALPVVAFYPNKARKSGYDSQCRECTRARARQRYEAKRTSSKPYRPTPRVDEADGQKHCFACDTRQPLANFYKTGQGRHRDNKCRVCRTGYMKAYQAAKRQEVAMLVDDLMQRAQVLANASARVDRINAALKAADAMYAALHEALQDGTPTAYSALKQAEALWVSARQAVDMPQTGQPH